MHFYECIQLLCQGKLLYLLQCRVIDTMQEKAAARSYDKNPVVTIDRWLSFKTEFVLYDISIGFILNF